MNFTPPFTGHIPTAAAIPNIQQFTAKFGYENNGAAAGVGVVQETRYQAGSSNAVQFAVAPDQGTLVEGVKYRQHESVVVMSAAPPPATVALAGMPMHTVTQAAQLGQGQQLVVVLTEPREAVTGIARTIKHETRLERTTNIQQPHSQSEYIIVSSGMGDVTDGAWQALSSGGVADYLSALPLPLHHLLKYSAPAEVKREEPTMMSVATNTLPPMPVLQQQPRKQIQIQNTNTVMIETATVVQAPPEIPVEPEVETDASKKKKKKRSPVKKKPRPKPGEIRLTTALDGSTLYCCPECHMAYPEQELLEQHLLGHTMERKFICNLCNAALKRKDHLTRHKQSHNPERPHICSVCLKAFKRKEQLTLHFVIHSGEKRHVCNECGKGFYRKDHLRKHTRSHIARRVKAELSAGTKRSSTPPLAAPAAPAPAPS